MRAVLECATPPSALLRTPRPQSLQGWAVPAFSQVSPHSPLPSVIFSVYLRNKARIKITKESAVQSPTEVWGVGDRQEGAQAQGGPRRALRPPGGSSHSTPLSSRRSQGTGCEPCGWPPPSHPWVKPGPVGEAGWLGSGPGPARGCALHGAGRRERLESASDSMTSRRLGPSRSCSVALRPSHRARGQAASSQPGHRRGAGLGGSCQAAEGRKGPGAPTAHSPLVTPGQVLECCCVRHVSHGPSYLPVQSSVTRV